MIKSPIRALFSALSLLLIFYVTAASSQGLPPSSDSSKSSAAPKPAKDPYGRETPQGMVAGLMNALAANDYERAVQFFQTDTIPGETSWSTLSGQALARRFKEVLDRAGSVITPAELSNDVNGNVTDGLAEDLERFGVVKTPAREVPLLAKRVKRDDKSLWLVSDSTLSEIPALARSIDGDSSTKSWIDLLPKGPTFVGAPVFHWLAIIIIVCLSFGLAWMLVALLRPLVRAIRRGGAETKVTRFIEASAGPVRLLIMLVLFSIAIQALGFSVVARYRSLFVAHLGIWLAIAWLLWRWVDAAGEVILNQVSRYGQLTAYSAISFFNRLVKGLLFVLVIAYLLRAFGVDVTAGLAALGVGGIAIALGAQKLIENLIGSLTLVADRPVNVGDFCRFGDKLGTIEEIGIRSTRVRTLDRTVLTVPNGQFSAMYIENYSHRDRFWFHPVLNLRYETTPNQMRFVLQSLRSMLGEHPKVDKESKRVRLIGLGAHSLDIEIFAYVYAMDYAGFLEIQEDLLLTCMEIVDRSGTGFAFPSQTLYLGRDSGLDQNRKREAEEAIRRQRGEIK